MGIHDAWQATGVFSLWSPEREMQRPIKKFGAQKTSFSLHSL
jgi:hypothetical protein